MPIRLPQLGPDPASPFPPVEAALREPEGLLAYGGDLDPRRLLAAYHSGIFPWYSDGEPILWWSPDPRTVFDTADFRLPARMRRTLRSSTWSVSADRAFDEVVACCAQAPRRGQHGTWITAGMRAAYGELHRRGHAHSIEVRDGERLVGGLYGIHVGGVFCGESMFSAISGGSKVALAAACREFAAWGIGLLDAQVPNPHLTSLGARPMARADYLSQLALIPRGSPAPGSWGRSFSLRQAAELA